MKQIDLFKRWYKKAKPGDTFILDGGLQMNYAVNSFTVLLKIDFDPARQVKNFIKYINKYHE